MFFCITNINNIKKKKIHVLICEFPFPIFLCFLWLMLRPRNDQLVAEGAPFFVSELPRSFKHDKKDGSNIKKCLTKLGWRGRRNTLNCATLIRSLIDYGSLEYSSASKPLM